MLGINHWPVIFGINRFGGTVAAPFAAKTGRQASCKNHVPMRRGIGHYLERDIVVQISFEFFCEVETLVGF